MIAQLKDVKWDNGGIAASVFMIIIMMILTCFISLGIRDLCCCYNRYRKIQGNGLGNICACNRICNISSGFKLTFVNLLFFF